MIKVNKLSYAVGNKRILQEISLEAHPGQLLAIIGPNGAGKSTLLKLLCKEIKSPEGTIFIHDRDIHSYSYSELALCRSVLSQANDVSINFKVDEMVLMGRYPHFDIHPTAADLDIVSEVIRDMGISHLQHRDYYSLSGGEKQRVQLARVLAQIYQHPQGILFLDEPINGLDIQYQQIILEKAKEMAKRNFTVVCILHDINFAVRYADKILILKEGQHMDYGDPNVIITAETLLNTYNTNVKIIHNEELGYPIIVPISSF